LTKNIEVRILVAPNPKTNHEFKLKNKRKFLSMRKTDRVLREVLHRFYERGERFFKQKELAKVCKISLGTINPIVSRLEQFGAIERRPLGFRLTEPRRALLYWAVTRDLEKDIAYATFVPEEIKKLEAGLPSDAILTAYSGFRAKFGTTPTDYHQVFVYADSEAIKRAFKPTFREKRNLFVLTPDEHLRQLSDKNVAPLVQIYVDLWQLGAHASRFVEELEQKFKYAPFHAFDRVAIDDIRRRLQNSDRQDKRNSQKVLRLIFQK
jgi:DNA-binding MarR family transcriptional regulator